jgi:GTP-binding protein
MLAFFVTLFLPMFVDRVEIEVAAGDGGNGVVAWRREKYIPKGGPAGGDGGKGGSIIVHVDPNTAGLEWFRHVRSVTAEHGQKGGSSCCKGKDGEDTILKIPPGTIVRDMQTNEVLFDGTTYHEEFVLCQGGCGGKGNSRFKSSTNRAPNIATPGEPGGRRRVEFELKLIGDVGLVGFPNAGKSTLLMGLTYTQVAVGPYPFTTLSPNIGYISFEGDRRVILTDIPGIIEHAHENRGLGLEFLRHIERTRVLLYVLDAAGVDGRDPLSDYNVLIHEIRSYDPALLDRPSCLVLNKCDLPESQAWVQQFRASVTHPYIVEVSGQTGEGLPKLKELIATLVFGNQEEPQGPEPIHDWEKLSHDEKLAAIKAVIDADVVPHLARDGGGVDVVDLVHDTHVVILYKGACATCHMALYGTLSFIQQVLSTKVHPSLIVVPSF